ncbi:Ketopantoate hydroxymethyltransferase [Moorella glycerini]|uniref:3-methyl-2-oxobutanoate hydroxymethyltransferase n=1 Tax=Neomoorella stamsii TaxID=1266720 RepID=A0A9X7P6L8_9FIRM|nr:MULTISPECIES: 3-methyl-2-oxobutanoate hydroxymethyltransferase [Moorella]PRR74026.1 3-methyl-2-oxobutanoate hydroxymethyltransferase [Moorella stamsii]CEP66842.1 Ketopantoate hydroxymethyltransferase [Moorella glycerini]
MAEEKTGNVIIEDSDKQAVKSSLMKKGRKTIAYLQQKKDNGEKIVQYCPASLDPYWTMAAEMAGVDVVRYTSPGETIQQRIENLPWWTRELRRVAPYIHLNCYMQTPMYANKYKALEYASILMAEGADSVLPMGINLETLRYLADNHVVVFGHVGALSGWQTSRHGGYKRCGQTAEAAMEIYRQAYEYQENGMMAMTIELTPREVTDAIAKKLRIPVIAVAAGGAADGSELVHFDMFGMMPKDRMGSHAKVYANYFEFAAGAIGAFAADVKSGGYPQPEHGYGMKEEELEKFLDMLEKA